MQNLNSYIMQSAINEASIGKTIQPRGEFHKNFGNE